MTLKLDTAVAEETRWGYLTFDSLFSVGGFVLAEASLGAHAATFTLWAVGSALLSKAGPVVEILLIHVRKLERSRKIAKGLTEAQ